MEPESLKPTIKLRFGGVSGRLKAEGRPAEFELRLSSPPAMTSPITFRTDFDPDDPAGLILRVGNPIMEPLRLVYGGGLNPLMNIVDERDMAVPAFGPIPIPFGD